MELEYKRPFLYAKQEEAFFNESRCSVILGSTKSGKSVAALIWLLEQALFAPKPGINYWWISPTHAQAKGHYRNLQSWLSDWPKEFSSFNDTEQIVKLAGAGWIYFKSGERADPLYGNAAHAVVVDEASRMGAEIFTVVNSITTATEGPLRLVGNVVGRDWFWNLHQKYLGGTNPNYSCHALTCWDAVEAGVVKREIIEDRREQLPDHIFKMLYENVVPDDGGNPFGTQSIISCSTETYIGTDGTTQRRPRAISTNQPVCWGWDLARSHDFTCGIALDSHGSVCKIERFQRNWESTAQAIVDITGTLPSVVDSSGNGDAVFEVISKNRPNFTDFKFTVSSKPQLLEHLIIGVQQGRLRFPQDSELYREMMSYQYQLIGNRVSYAAPTGMHDDAVTALALAYKCFAKPAKRYLLDHLDSL